MLAAARACLLVRASLLALVSALKAQSTQPRESRGCTYQCAGASPISPCFLHAAHIMDMGVSCSILAVMEVLLLLLLGGLPASGLYLSALSEAKSHFIQDEILSDVAHTQ